uniref:SFRICE_041719 n=1 Tax=Spodoptera frugiperda TaxID=7108 RepID=A0A2H1VUP9_SPOFR
MILKIGGKSPPGAKTTSDKEVKKEEKKETKKKWEKCEERCPGDPWAYCVVLWCACAMSLISSGYSLYKQQALTERLSLLEEQHLALRSAVLEPQQPLVERLRREVLARPPTYWRPRRSIRDYGDCGCPPGEPPPLAHISLQQPAYGNF